MNFTPENIELVKKFIEIKNKGYHCNGKQLTAVYNQVLGKNVPSTNCSSCLRQRVSELEKALNEWKAQTAKEASEIAQDEPKQEDLATTKEDEKEAAQAADNERGEKGETESVPLKNITKKRGRPKLKKEE